MNALADRYRIERELGAGGMATVYLAHDLKHDRAVAVKVLHADLVQELGAERFLSEIKTTARLRHPNILPLFDSGVAQSGDDSLLYYVMPFIDGVSLRARLNRDGKLPVEESLRIAVEVADALGYAHDHGVIHRDIKPENILLEGGHALVADFGIALATAAPGAERLTQSGMSLGTPAYMSPEQSTGDRDIDARSDVYSLACVLYEMLTEPPFAGPTFESILVKRFTQQPPRVTIKRSGVHRQVDAAVFGAMAREPDQRPASMARFRDALTTRASPAAADAPKSIAVLPFANMSAERENEYFSDGIAEEIINALTQLPELRVAARTSAFSFKGKNEDLRAIGDALNVETVLEGSVRKAGNRVRVTAQLINVADGYHLWSERYDRELTDVFAIQDEIASAIAEKLKVTLATAPAGQLVRPPTANVEAYEAFLKARSLARARGRSLFEATAWYERAIALDPEYAAPHAGLAYALLLQSFWGMARPDVVRERAIVSAQRALDLDSDLVDSHLAAALVAMCFERDWERAAVEWARVREIDSASTEPRALWATFWMTYGLGKLDEAVEEARGVAEADPLSAYAHANAALALGWNRRLDEATTEARTALELDPLSTYAHWSLLHSLGLRGDVDGASAAFAEACARVGRHPWFLVGLAIAFSRVGRRDAAGAVYDELSARSKLEYVQPTVLGWAAGVSGRIEDAIRLYHLAIDLGDPLVVVSVNWPGVDWGDTPEWDDALRRIGSPAAVAAR
jgi:serine/threonine protein kinase